MKMENIKIGINFPTPFLNNQKYEYIMREKTSYSDNFLRRLAPKNKFVFQKYFQFSPFEKLT